ncbi:MAG: PH domain-containing protein [Pseudomonadota bacterium]
MAGYVQKTLAPDEKLIHDIDFNWTFSFFPVLWFAFGSAPIVMYSMMVFGTIGEKVAAEELRVGWWFVGISFAIGLIILVNHLIVLWTTEIAVTTYRFVYKTGLIARHTQEVSLNKIEEITLEQSVWGRIFGYGKLILRGTGVGVISLPNIDNPIGVRRIIEQARADLRRNDRDERTGDAD